MISGETIKVGNRPDGIAIHDIDGTGKNVIVLSNFDDNNIMILYRY